MKVAIYTRVSTSDQTTQNQLMDLEEVIERNNWEVVEFYDEVISGTKGVDERFELARMLKDAQRKKFEKLIIWSVDRLGRNLKNIIGVLSTLHESGIEVFSYKQGIDTSTTMGRSFMAITGIFAEIENDGVPTEDNVADIFDAILPLLPTPQIITFDLHLMIALTASLKELLIELFNFFNALI